MISSSDHQNSENESSDNSISKDVDNTNEQITQKRIYCPLSFLDFFPSTRRKDNGWFFQSTQETFSDLMKKINSWLKMNYKWRVKNLETLLYDQDSLFNREFNSFRGSFVNRNHHGIRVWVEPNTCEDQSAQQIGCINVLPRLKYGKGETTTVTAITEATLKQQNECRRQSINSASTINELKEPIFETIDEVLERTNCFLKKETIKGKLLCTETVAIPVIGNWTIDTESTYWSKQEKNSNPLAHILRIYFELDSPLSIEPTSSSSSSSPFSPSPSSLLPNSKEELTNENVNLCIKDFLPEKEIWNSPLAIPNYEPFSSLSRRVSSWLNKNAKNIQFLNCQTMEMPIDKANNIDNRAMYFKRQRNDFILRFIRVTFISNENENNNIDENGESEKCKEKVNEEIDEKQILLNCKTFVPTRISSNFDYERTWQTREKIESWLIATGAKVMSVETSVMKLSYSITSIAAALDSTIISLTASTEGSHWITIYRIYVDGYVVEPPLRNYPQIIRKTNAEDVEEGNCIIN